MGRLLSACLAALSLVTWAFAASPQKESVNSGGWQRSYYVFVPDKLAVPAPLLLLLHGSGRDGMSQIDVWKKLAGKEGIILVAPDSADSRHWVFSTDGPEFLHDVIESVRARYKVNGQRIYIFGHSAGATFALYMATMEPNYFAAAAVHAGAVKEEYRPLVAHAARKLPMAIWVGTKDQFYSLDLVRAAAKELNQRGFEAHVLEIEGHDHNYYAVAADLSPKVWAFLSGSKLMSGPRWDESQK